MFLSALYSYISAQLTGFIETLMWFYLDGLRGAHIPLSSIFVYEAKTRIRRSSLWLYEFMSLSKNAAVINIRKDQAQYQKSLVRKMKRSPKMFYSYVRSKQRNAVSVTTVRNTERRLSSNDTKQARLCVISFSKFMPTWNMWTCSILFQIQLMICLLRICLLGILSTRSCAY